MTLNRKWSDVIDEVHAKDRARHEKRVAAVRAAVRLDELRRARRMSQEELARRLNSQQAQVSRLEQRADLFVSTVRRYVEALGGELEIVATFPDGTVRIDNFRELSQGYPRTHETPAERRAVLRRKRRATPTGKTQKSRSRAK